MDTTTDSASHTALDPAGASIAAPAGGAAHQDQVGEAEHEAQDEVASGPAEGTDDSTPAEADAAGSLDQAPRRSKADDLVREGEVAADFLETLMDITDLDGDLEVDVDGDRAAVSIVDSEEGSVPRRLIGPKAAVLEALQELTRLAVQAETGDRSRLMLDIGGHRADRKQALIQSAAEVIGAVQSTGTRSELEPMTAFERKVVHDEVLQAGLRSESEGEEPRRYVVVLPAL